MPPVTARFLLIAPPVGAFGFIVADQLLMVAGVRVSYLAQPDTPSAIFATVPVLWLYGFVLAYPIGLVPAFLCEICCSYLLTKANRYEGLMRGLVGAGTGSIFSSALGGCFLINSAVSWLGLLPWVAAGFLGGGVAALASNFNPKRLSSAA